MKLKKKKKKKIFFFFRETPLLPSLLLGRNFGPRATISPQSPSSLFPVDRPLKCPELSGL